MNEFIDFFKEKIKKDQEEYSYLLDKSDELLLSFQDSMASKDVPSILALAFCKATMNYYYENINNLPAIKEYIELTSSSVEDVLWDLVRKKLANE